MDNAQFTQLIGDLGGLKSDVKNLLELSNRIDDRVESDRAATQRKLDEMKESLDGRLLELTDITGIVNGKVDLLSHRVTSVETKLSVHERDFKDVWEDVGELKVVQFKKEGAMNLGKFLWSTFLTVAGGGFALLAEVVIRAYVHGS